MHFESTLNGGLPPDATESNEVTVSGCPENSVTVEPLGARDVERAPPEELQLDDVLGERSTVVESSDMSGVGRENLQSGTSCTVKL